MDITAIAKKANVSIATISRALSPDQRHRVAPKTLKKVEALVKKYGYTPSLGARSMRCTEFRTIGVVLPNFNGIFFTDFYVQVLRGVTDALFDSGYRFKLVMLASNRVEWDENNRVSSRELPEALWDRYNFKTAEGVDGLVVVHWPLFFSHARVMEKIGIPCAAIGDAVGGSRVNFFTEDSYQGGEMAAKYLYQKNHRRLVIMAGLSTSVNSVKRVEGFKSFFKKMSQRSNVTVLKGDFHEDVAGNVIDVYFRKSRKKPTAIFCCNDLMAFGVMDRLRQRGVLCPRDVSVIGYDDDPRAGAFNPALTTIHAPVYELSRDAAARLVSGLKGNFVKTTKSDSFYPVTLIERKSVRQL